MSAVAAAALFPVASPWGSLRAQTAPTNRTLTVGVRTGPESIDPHWSTLGGHIEALRHIFDSLVGQDENLNLKPNLALSWTAVDPTTWEFKLRPGVKFHDGSDFTAEDVKFSFDRIPVVTGPMSMTLYTKQAVSAEVVDPLTVRFKTRGPAPALPNDFARLMIVSHRIGMEPRNEEFNSGKAAIGTGAFRFVKWEPRGDLVMERFDGWWGGTQPWARVIRREIPNDAARIAALKSGQVDLFNYVPATDVNALKRDATMDVVVGDSVYVFNVYFSLAEKLPKPAKVDGREIEANPFRDPRVREAFDLATDRRALARVVFEGLAKPMSQLMPDNFFGASPNLPERRPDLARARALLAEAGYPKGFEIDFFSTSNRLPGDGALCEALAQQWSRVGIKANPNAVTGTVFFPASTRGEYSLQMSGWGTLTGEAAYTYGAMIHGPDPSVGLGNFNRSGYNNPEVNRLLLEGSRTLDDAKRKEMFIRATDISMNDRPMLPIVMPQTVWAMGKGKLSFTPRVDQETLAHLITPKG
ncbi:ABC transporter substrate-binding protein [Roseomonas sp. OT10]|uniref:ABC transporter substrate-binding protein n=1 Tax=Roseomonas cutis TaxID=2897332 RepID=UPI001E5B365A|nr:ABC transporter substrate-binding protein [Roseomonas sp. OT10]UFN48152.1 ABC transporter substrate-binding protein [Roseomonas sp. OT10]